MKNDRHTAVEVVCVCGKTFLARKERVEKGQGRFCSKQCFDNWQRENIKSARIGKENARLYHKQSGGYFVQWIQENGKPQNEPWHNWAWEMNFGDIPTGYRVEYKDENQDNISIDNLQLRLTRSGKKLLPKHKKVLSEEHKIKIGNRTVELWKNGVFDFHKGTNNKNYKSNKTKHPKEFNDELKEFVRERDNHICQICGKDLSRGRKGTVHHIDGIKSHNDSENLILFCNSCHIKVHFSVGNTSPAIMAFRERLVLE